MGDNKFLIFLDTHKYEIAFLIFVLPLVFQWFLWMFGLGRFKKKEINDENSDKDDVKPIRYILVDLFAKIIDDFRHLLALIVILIFAIILGLSMFHTGFKIENMGDALQAVVSTLGGLVGSIIGYYFGESAAMKRNTEEAPIRTISVPQAIQSPDKDLEDDSIKLAPEVDKDV